MPLKCCIPKCCSNYRGTPYVTVFRFPKDEELKKVWLRKIPRDIKPTNNSVVCIKHFEPKFIITHDNFSVVGEEPILVLRGKPKLTEGSYPTLFPELPQYLSEKSKIQRQAPSKRSEMLDKRYEEAFQKDLEILNDRNQLESFDNFVTRLKDEKIPSGWIHSTNEKYAEFYFVDRSEMPPKVHAYLYIEENFKFKVFAHEVEISSQKLHTLGCCNTMLSCWDEVHHLLVTVKNLVTSSHHNSNVETLIDTIIVLLDKVKMFLEDEDHRMSRISFLTDQLKLFCLPLKRSKYSTETLMFSYCLFSKSPSAYEFVRESHHIQLPHPQTLRKLSKSFLDSPSNEDAIHFLEQKNKLLNPEERVINLLLDEIYIQPSLQYKAGKLVGVPHNDTKDLATSIHTFLLSSIFSNNKDVVRFVPVKSMSAEELFKQTIACIKSLEKAGYSVLCIITDNNSINRKLFSLLLEGSNFPHPVANHPCGSGRPLFLLYDSVHLLKSIRNNWLAQSRHFSFPSFPNRTEANTANFQHLIHLYSAEKSTVVKYGYLLTENVLFPSNLQKQKVSLALKIFDRSNIMGLNKLGSQRAEYPQWENWEGTAAFLSIIIDFWEIVNVKSCSKGIKKRNDNMKPIRSFDDLQVKFLKEFLVWVENWYGTNAIGKNCGGLSRETFNALTHTTKTYLRLLAYALNERGWDFVLLGKFQTDKLEARFGQFRQLSGCNYNVSLQQVYESEKKLKISNILKLKSAKFGDISISEFSSFFDKESDENFSSSDLTLIHKIISEDLNLEFNQDIINNIVYIVGYSCFQFSKKSSCDYCKDMLCSKESLYVENVDISFIDLCNRGGLTYPKQISINAGLISYAAFQRLISSDFESDFLRAENHFKVFLQIMKSFLLDDEVIVTHCAIQCLCGTKVIDNLHKIVKMFGNVFIRNYSRNKFPTKISTKRKLQTLNN